MKVDFDKFVKWAEDRFNGEIIVKGLEVRINSIFCDDYKYHLWCNPSGGKNNRPGGVYHCFKTDKKGSLINLIMTVDKCSFEEALDKCGSGSDLHEVENTLKEFFQNKQKETEECNKTLSLPPYTTRIDRLPLNMRLLPEQYLTNRKISIGNLLFCTKGKYKDRIIIPYYDKSGNLIYFNSRSVLPNTPLRYRGPPKECGVGKEDVLFVPKWKQGGKLYLTEGEFDALVLYECGFNSAAFGGKNMSDKQLRIMENYQIVLALDNDVYGSKYFSSNSAGLISLRVIGDKLIKSGFKDIRFIRPPEGYKDWNYMLEKHSIQDIQQYIELNERNYDEEYSLKLKMSEIG